MTEALSFNRKLPIAAVALSLLVGGSFAAQAKEWTSIKIATEGNYEPWNLTLPGGKVGGFEPELVANLCKRIKIKCELTTQNWDGMIAGLNAGKYDVIMDSIVITPERKKVINFSIPYAATPASFITKKTDLLSKAQDNVIKIPAGSSKIDAVVAPLQKALEGKIIGMQSGSVYTDFLDKYFAKSTVREYSSAAAAILDLRSGRIDAVFDDVTFSNAFLSKPANKSIHFAGPKIGGSIWGAGEALGFRKSDTDLSAKFDAAIKAALKDGTVKKLSQKWFHTDVTP